MCGGRVIRGPGATRFGYSVFSMTKSIRHSVARLAGFLFKLAVLLVAMQIPLIGIRWSIIIDVLDPLAGRMDRGKATAIFWIGLFFGQAVPGVVSEALRVWMIARLGRSTRVGLASVIVDRGI